jgi:hypothetical protein
LSAKGLQLTARDRVLLESLAALRVLTTRQVQRLLFPSEQIALRRLRRLAECGYLRLDSSVASPHRLVTLTGRGHIAIGSDAPDRNGIHERNALFLQHRLGTNAFRLALGQACARRSDFELVRFIADGNVKAGRAGAQPQRALKGVLGADGHVPDGLFVLRRAARSALFFFEYDRGTEVLGNPERGLGRIVYSYLKAFASGSYRRAGELLGARDQFQGFRALIVTTTPARIANIRRHWASLSGPIAAGKRFVWLASAAVLESEDVFAERWVPLEASDDRTYAIAGGQP